MSLPLASVRIRGFRTAHDVTLALGPVTALVGEAAAGKSNLLVAVWKLLAGDSSDFEPADVAAGTKGPVRIEGLLDGGHPLRVEAKPDGGRCQRAGTSPPAVFLPAAERSSRLVADGAARRAEIEDAVAESASPALALVQILEQWLEDGASGTVLLIEEPELFLRPHAQRALYRLLRDFALQGNQVLYSTHAATFLNVARLEEIALVDRGADGATRIRRPERLPEPEAFRTVNEFDAERSELLLARAAILVEGRTEKLVFPFFFRALGFDADREGISIVECGGKPNIPIIAAVCSLVGLPYLVVHDRDAAAGRAPIAAERAVNEAIARIAGPERTTELAPDFEGVTHLHGRKHKPEQAVEWVADAGADQVPEPLAATVRRIVELARKA